MREWASELWQFRELLYFLAWRDVALRYKQAALGAAWAILQPLLGMLIFTLFFGRLAKMPSDGVPYPLFVYCALLPWTYFSTVLSLGGNSLVGNSNLITKVYFPRVLLPAASAVAGLLDFVIGGSFLVLLMVYYRVEPTWHLLLVPLFMAGLLLVTTGVSMLFAALNVRYRDVKHAVPFVVQLWLFVTPIIYPATIVPERFRTALAMNPCWGIIEGFRSCLVGGQHIDVNLVGTSMFTAAVIFCVGATYFRKTERTFADII
jgi:lipopolysaccharide transport system permease protein